MKRNNKRILQISNFKYMYLYLFLLICLFAYLFIAEQSSAQTMINEDYRVQVGDIDSSTDKVIIEDYSSTSALNPTTPGVIKGKNYKIKLGFNYTPDSFPFLFSISNTENDFGTLSPTNPITRTTNLSVTNIETDGYNVSAAENHELTAPTTGATIPDTTCDDGNCSENIATPWINTLTYGFGYRCDKADSACINGDSSFQEKDNFKHFPNSSKDESAVSIMTGGSGIDIKSTILFKVNTSSSQPAGPYSNIVTFLATPNY